MCRCNEVQSNEAQKLELKNPACESKVSLLAITFPRNNIAHFRMETMEQVASVDGLGMSKGTSGKYDGSIAACLIGTEGKLQTLKHHIFLMYSQTHICVNPPPSFEL